MKLTLVPVLLITTAAAHGEALLTFEKDVRPILKTHCTHCHGIDESSRKGGLRLDERAAASAIDQDPVP